MQNIKIYLYVVVMTIAAGAPLAVLNNVLGPTISQNRKEARLTSILKSVPGWSPEQANGQIEQFFKQTVKTTLVNTDGSKEYVSTGDAAQDQTFLSEINQRSGSAYRELSEVDPASEEKVAEAERLYPIYTYDKGNGEQLYIVAIRGKGLWDKIWGYISLDKTMTVQGVYFDHKAETPGLGAEIKDSDKFKAQFQGKKMYEGGELVSIKVMKKAPKGTHEVQGISGATVTSNGVSDMLQSGMAKYKAYFEKMKKAGQIAL